jgi:hypothetical protein
LQLPGSLWWRTRSNSLNNSFCWNSALEPFRCADPQFWWSRPRLNSSQCRCCQWCTGHWRWISFWIYFTLPCSWFDYRVLLWTWVLWGTGAIPSHSSFFLWSRHRCWEERLRWGWACRRRPGDWWSGRVARWLHCQFRLQLWSWWGREWDFRGCRSTLMPKWCFIHCCSSCRPQSAPRRSHWSGWSSLNQRFCSWHSWAA